MVNSVKDAHAVVTGAGQGIGAAIAAELDRLGARLTLMGRRLEPLQRQSRTFRSAIAVAADVTDEPGLSAAFDEARRAFGPVSILVNNAGAVATAPFARTDTGMWRSMLDVNLTGVFYCMRAALPDMQKTDWGRIINIASTAGIKGYPYVAAYCAAKHGVVGLTRALALETAQTGITVNAVCPGYTDTELLQDAIRTIMEKTGMDREKAESMLKSTNPQRRFVEPGEVAATVAWLCRPGSESITGQAIAVAGGEVMP
jgi:NAD(P)-dependent dehydrogenase (short-subunit alcohol dehydrogenase family)